jgi:hypothetical protein
MRRNQKRITTVQTKWINHDSKIYMQHIVKLHVHCQSWLINAVYSTFLTIPLCLYIKRIF